MNKPTVHYTPMQGDVIRLGISAYIKPVDHYNNKLVSNKKFIFTSKVIKVDSGGVFETLNSIYRPKLS
jgi:hypothetical protein